MVSGQCAVSRFLPGPGNAPCHCQDRARTLALHTGPTLLAAPWTLVQDAGRRRQCVSSAGQERQLLRVGDGASAMSTTTATIAQSNSSARVLPSPARAPAPQSPTAKPILLQASRATKRATKQQRRTTRSPKSEDFALKTHDDYKVSPAPVASAHLPPPRGEPCCAIPRRPGQAPTAPHEGCRGRTAAALRNWGATREPKATRPTGTLDFAEGRGSGGERRSNRIGLGAACRISQASTRTPPAPIPRGRAPRPCNRSSLPAPDPRGRRRSPQATCQREGSLARCALHNDPLRATLERAPVPQIGSSPTGTPTC